MPYLLNRLGKALFPGVCLLLIAACVTAAPISVFFHSTIYSSHILPNYSLYKADTARYSPVPGCVRRERNGDLVIAVPAGMLGRYKVCFFDADHYYLFEVRQILDSLLIVEKSNFQHAGRFQYELYCDNALVEKGSFLIKRD